MTELKAAEGGWLPWRCRLCLLWKTLGSAPQPTAGRGEGGTGREQQTLGHAKHTVNAQIRLIAALKILKNR